MHLGFSFFFTNILLGVGLATFFTQRLIGGAGVAD